MDSLGTFPCAVSLGTCAALALGALPLFIWLVWSWNEVRFLLPLKLRSNGANLPPGHMGLPLLGEMLSFLWYFKIVRRPDDFILSKRKRYGRGVGLYRTHLFGSPSIIACEPSINKFILQSDDLFAVNWPTDIVGSHSLVAVNGAPHSRVRTFVVNALNKPEALKQITLAVQPRLISSLHHWANKGRIKASDEITKVTFENICKMFVSLDPGPLVVDINKSIKGVVAGIRAQPFNFSGTAYHRALQCRNKLTEEFRRMLEARKKGETVASDEEMNDLMDGLRQIRDEEGKQLGDEEVLDNIISLVIAGYESTSIATMWSLYYLCKYPNVLRQIRAENMEIRELKKGDGDFLTMDDISEMKYTRKVVEETIRIANISPTIFRRANEDVDYQGYRIPKDWQVIVWIRHLHTDPDNFQDPFHFNPDRWDTSPKPGTYQVFGGGSRICAGNMLVRIQLSIFLHHLTTGYRWELVNPDAKITYLPHPKPADGAEMTFHAL